MQVKPDLQDSPGTWAWRVCPPILNGCFILRMLWFARNLTLESSGFAGNTGATGQTGSTGATGDMGLKGMTSNSQLQSHLSHATLCVSCSSYP